MARAVGTALITVWMHFTALNEAQTQTENWFKLLFLYNSRTDSTLLLWFSLEPHGGFKQSKVFSVAVPELNKNKWMFWVSNRFTSLLISVPYYSSSYSSWRYWEITSVCAKIHIPESFEHCYKWLHCRNLLWNFLIVVCLLFRNFWSSHQGENN